MTGLETIPKIAELIASLLRKAGDKETLGLAKQIQTYQLIIEKELKEKDVEIARMKKVIDELESKLKNQNIGTFEPIMIDPNQGRND
jgi:hypothetical protein